MMFIGDATVIGSFNNQFAEFGKVTYMFFQRKNSPYLHSVTLSSCGHSLHLFYILHTYVSPVCVLHTHMSI